VISHNDCHVDCTIKIVPGIIIVIVVISLSGISGSSLDFNFCDILVSVCGFLRSHILAAFCGFSRVQLGVCVSQIVKQDFPGKWPGVAEKVLMYLKSDRHDTWLGALVCLHQLVKHFEYVMITFSE